jgi:nucleoside-diphosphate-sugar epimerase
MAVGMAMDALVTGATGFLGQYIVEGLLERGDRVKALVRRESPELRALGAETVFGDLRDRDAIIAACESVETVFHAGGVTGLGVQWKDFYRTNALGTRWVIEGCRKHGVGRLIYTSSPSVVFDGKDQRGVDETVPYPCRWLSKYAHSKALAEQDVLSANGPGGLATCVIRPHLIWGPRDRSLVPKLWERARKGRLVQVGDGTNHIDTTYVENAARAHIQAADALRPDSAVAGKAYFVSQGQPLNCWTWINQLLDMAGLPCVKRSISFSKAWALGTFFEAAYRVLGIPDDPPMTRFLAAQMSRSHWFSIARARADFGYVPAVSTVEGMRRMADWAARDTPLNHGIHR